MFNVFSPPFEGRQKEEKEKLLSSLRVFFHQGKLFCLITMLIELNCFFTLLCEAMERVCENNFALFRWWNAKEKRIFHYLRLPWLLALALCVSSAAEKQSEEKNTSHTNLSSFHKSKLWIYQFFRSLFCAEWRDFIFKTPWVS